MKSFMSVKRYFVPKIADRILSSQAMTPTSGDARNSDSRPIGNFGSYWLKKFSPDFKVLEVWDGLGLPFDFQDAAVPPLIQVRP
jgi:hypothetical protein